MTVDPVCGTSLEEMETAVLTYWNGQLFAFCGHRCLKAFAEEPERYAKDSSSGVAKAS